MNFFSLSFCESIIGIMRRTFSRLTKRKWKTQKSTTLKFPHKFHLLINFPQITVRFFTLLIFLFYFVLFLVLLCHCFRKAFTHSKHYHARRTFSKLTGLKHSKINWVFFECFIAMFLLHLQENIKHAICCMKINIQECLFRFTPPISVFS